MKVNSFSFLRVAAVALLGSLMLPVEAEAKHKTRYRSGGHSRHYSGHYYHHHSSPRVGVALSFGSGYGYYGPRYYYPSYYRPYRYYRPSRVYYGGYYDRCDDVQRSLYELGYYYGPIDGICGPATRSAIIRYRSGRGLAVTAVIDRPLLVNLGLW
jgi:hypothetical protein